MRVQSKFVSRYQFEKLPRIEILKRMCRMEGKRLRNADFRKISVSSSQRVRGEGGGSSQVQSRGSSQEGGPVRGEVRAHISAVLFYST